MTKLITLDISEQTVNAFGHPSNCTEPALGSVSQYESETNNVTVTNATDSSSRFATRADANLYLPSHAHDHSVLQGCHEDQSHYLLPDKDSDASSVTVNQSPIFINGDSVTTDPTSGGRVSLTNEVNESVTYSPA